MGKHTAPETTPATQLADGLYQLWDQLTSLAAAADREAARWDVPATGIVTPAFTHAAVAAARLAVTVRAAQMEAWAAYQAAAKVVSGSMDAAQYEAAK